MSATVPHWRRDRMGRAWLTIADDQARALVAFRRRTWREYHGCAAGESGWIAVDNPLHSVARAIHETILAAVDCGEDWRRYGAPFVAGASYPVDGPYCADLLVSTCGLEERAGRYRISG